MSNPFAKTFEELRSPFLHEKMAKKDYDGDGKIETGTQEYMGSRDKAIKKAMGKDPKKEMKKEHHQKDADGKVIEHEDTAPASLDELSNRTMRNYIIKGTSDVAKRASDPDSDEGPKYKKLRSRMDGVMSAGDKLARRADKKEKKEEISYTAPVKAPHFSDWKEEMHWEALKGKKLDINDSGKVNNKIEINPEIKTEAAKAEVKKPKKAQDAGARGRRLLQRKEYAAKVSGSEDRVPDDLRDSVQYDENLDNIKNAIKTGIKNVGKGLKNFMNRPIMKDTPTQKQYQDSIKQGTSNQFSSYEPEGEMIDEIEKKFGTPGNTLGDASDKVMNKVKYGTPVKKIDKKIKKLNMGDDLQEKDTRTQITSADVRLNSGAYKAYIRDKNAQFGTSKRFNPIIKTVDHYEPEADMVSESDKKGKGSGTKDACYHKVKSRYSVWPSAYASGALVKCRKVGAKNWGNSSKKEEVNWDFEMKSFGAYAAECWKTHEQRGMKKKGGKMVPNCVPKGSGRTKNEERTPALNDPAFDIMRPGGANSPLNPDGTLKRKSLNRVRGTAFKGSRALTKEEKKKLSNTSPLSDRVSNWSKKMNEGDVYVKSNRNKLTGLPNLGKGDKKSTEKKITGVDYKTMLQSYEPQGETIDEKRKFSGMGDLAKKYGLDPNNANDYMKLKNMMRKGLKRNIQDRLAPPEV